MKAITIHQPYAELIARGEKLVENRTWNTRHRGLVAIHASAFRRRRLDAIAADHQVDTEDVPRGAIVAVAELVDCVPLAEVKGRKLTKFAVGPRCWVLANVRRIERPIPAAGRQSLWNLTAEQVAAVESQLG